MRVYQINVVCGTGSTGRIAADISRAVEEAGGRCRIAYGRGKAPDDVDSFRISNRIDLYYHAFMTRLTDRHGLYSKHATKRLLRDIQTYNPDVIHLHNIHGYYLNYEMLFGFLKKYGKPVVWTLHDCWAFTGHCSHFSAVGCNQWEKKCKNCCQLKQYPACSMKGNVQNNFYRKKTAFSNMSNVRILVPSQWLEDIVKRSFLGSYPIEVLYNYVDTDLFRPTEGKFRERYHLQNKKIVLGVANIWNERKGFYEMLELAQRLGESYAVVMVGLNKKQLKELPEGVIGLEQTSNTRELADIYSAADVYVNLSIEETFGLTTVEAIACGTPAIVYKGTACEEIARKTGGIVIDSDMDELVKAIQSTSNKIAVLDKRLYTKETYMRKIHDIYKEMKALQCQRTNR